MTSLLGRAGWGGDVERAGGWRPAPGPRAAVGDEPQVEALVGLRYAESSDPTDIDRFVIGTAGFGADDE